MHANRTTGLAELAILVERAIEGVGATLEQLNDLSDAEFVTVSRSGAIDHLLDAHGALVRAIDAAARPPATGHEAELRRVREAIGAARRGLEPLLALVGEQAPLRKEA